MILQLAGTIRAAATDSACNSFPASSLLEDPRFLGMLKNLRYNPGMRQMQPTFLDTCAYLNGEAQASKDLELLADPARALFDGFKNMGRTVEESRGSPPWFKVVQYWRGGDENTMHEGFFTWLDEYAAEMGQEGIFRTC